MNFDDGGVQAQCLDKSLLPQMIENFRKHSAIGPAIQLHVNGVPRVEPGWQGSPFDAIAGHIGRSIEESEVAD